MSTVFFVIALALIGHAAVKALRAHSFSATDAVTVAAALISFAIALASPIDFSGIDKLFQSQLTLGQAAIVGGAFVVVLILILIALGRYENKKRSKSITSNKEYFGAIWDSVLWEIDNSLDEKDFEERIITGPLCKACKMLMVPNWMYVPNPRSRRESIPDTITRFVCPSCGNIVTPPSDLKNDVQIKSRVLELYRADKRKQEMTKKKLVA
jgi:hypothetical protein